MHYVFIALSLTEYTINYTTTLQIILSRYVHNSNIIICLGTVLMTNLYRLQMICELRYFNIIYTPNIHIGFLYTGLQLVK